MFLMTVRPLLTDFPKTLSQANREISARLWNTYYLPIRKRSQNSSSHCLWPRLPGLQPADTLHGAHPGGLPGRRGSAADPGPQHVWQAVYEENVEATEYKRKLGLDSSYPVVPDSAGPLCSASLGDGNVLVFISLLLVVFSSRPRCRGWIPLIPLRAKPRWQTAPSGTLWCVYRCGPSPLCPLPVSFHLPSVHSGSATRDVSLWQSSQS